MSSVPLPSGASFRVANSRGSTVYQAPVGAQLGIWGHSAKVTYQIYALDFYAQAGICIPSTSTAKTFCDHLPFRLRVRMRCIRVCC